MKLALGRALDDELDSDDSFDLEEPERDEDEPHRCERLGCENSDATFYSDAGMHLCHDCRARAEQ